MTRSYLKIIYNLKSELAGLYSSSEFFYYSTNIVSGVLLAKIAYKSVRKLYLKRQFKEIKLQNSKGKLKFREYRDRFEFYIYNSNFSDLPWWQNNLSKIESITGLKLLKVAIKDRKLRQNKVIIFKDLLPKTYSNIIKDLNPLEFNAGKNQEAKKLKESLINKSSIGFFMQTDQGKTSLKLTILIDLIWSFRKKKLPVLVVSAPKDGGADYRRLKKIYKRVEIYDTSTIKGLRSFIERFKEVIEVMQIARDQAAKDGIVPNHDIKIPDEYMYPPFFVVLDEVFQTIKTKGVTKEKRELAYELQQLIDLAIRQWRSKLSKVLISSQNAGFGELDGISIPNIGIVYYGTVKSTLKHTGLLPDDSLYARSDFKKGKYLLHSTNYHEIVRTPYYGESDSLKNIPFNFKKLELKNGKKKEEDNQENC